MINPIITSFQLFFTAPSDLSVLNCHYIRLELKTLLWFDCPFHSLVQMEWALLTIGYVRAEPGFLSFKLVKYLYTSDALRVIPIQGTVCQNAEKKSDFMMSFQLKIKCLNMNDVSVSIPSDLTQFQSKRVTWVQRLNFVLLSICKNVSSVSRFTKFSKTGQTTTLLCFLWDESK